MTHRDRRRRNVQLGLSLVEAAVAMVIMGVAATLSWQAIRSNSSLSHRAETREQLERAKGALLAYVALKNHLPCPASQPDGWEDCTPNNTRDRFFPYRTVGVPEPKMARLRYVPYSLAGLPPRKYENGKFHVLLNDQPISITNAPRAESKPLESVASTTYDGILDTCDALSRIGEARINAFSLEKLPGDDGFTSGLRGTQLKVRAAQVSDYLSCIPLAAVGGRSQYHAHLASAILNKTVQEYKWVFEADYGTYNLDLAEAAFFMSTKLYGELTRWPKTIQALSKFLESRFSDVNAIRMMFTSVINQAASLASVVAQGSNVARFVTNLEAARARYRIILDLMKRADAVYLTAWQNAVLSSSSAYFLREQTEQPLRPAPLGSVDPGSVNPTAESMIRQARERAEGFGASVVSSALKPLPTSDEVVPGSSLDFAADTEPLPDLAGMDAPDADASADYIKETEDMTLDMDLDLRPDPDARTPTQEEIDRGDYDFDDRIQEIERGLKEEAARRAERRK